MADLQKRRKVTVVAIIVAVALLLPCFILCCVGMGVAAINGAVIIPVCDQVYRTVSDIDVDGNFDCVLILGAGLQSDGTPSHMLEDRIKTGVEVFNSVDADLILMSGDKSGEYYDEPSAMKKYAEELGVDPSLIEVDNEGYSTFESIVRAKEIYGFDRIIVITQEYHLYRALYIAEQNGVDSIGVSADLRTYRSQIVRDVREIFARIKDFVMCI